MLILILCNLSCISFDSYIKPQLRASHALESVSCISFDSYIKPQLWHWATSSWVVVYLLIPTSNHNVLLSYKVYTLVVYLLIPTSNHNVRYSDDKSELVVYLLIPTSNHNLFIDNEYTDELYIFWFLHQTTTLFSLGAPLGGCISFDSYIKPQLDIIHHRRITVVYLLIPTSNHNEVWRDVYLLKLYIFWFLHQTTTSSKRYTRDMSCISFDSYIKPQLILYVAVKCFVVYLLIPTSNHNVAAVQARTAELYIFWFLHQTTTVVTA